MRDAMPVLQLSREDAPAARARAVVFEDPLSRALLSRIEQVAPTDATVLITGETGTGKEIVARNVHEGSSRAKAPFVPVNCGALSPSLMDSELFGHERGAFTGALASKPGWFEAADGGTLFLDEIGDLPLAAQVKLLRVLQEREVVRLGSRRAIPVDVRLVAATNIELGQAVADGRFREDLYYRLHVAHLAIAPLRDRRADVLPLAHHLLSTYAPRLGIEHVELTDSARERLLAHSWPGNIRELENAMHHALLVARNGRVTGDDVNLLAPNAAARARTSPVPPPTDVPKARDPREALKAALLDLFDDERPDRFREIEAIVFRTAYEVSDKNQLRAARLLGLSRNIVRARLLEHGVLEGASRERDAAMRVASPLPKGRTSRVRIAHQSFGVLSLLKATGALEDAFRTRGVRVEWTDCATGMHVVDALAAGSVDLGVVGEAPPVFAQAAHAPFVYLAAEPPAPEGEAIVVPASSGVRSMADLRGKVLAVSRGANVVYFLLRALEEAGLAMDDVEVRTLSPEHARAAFERQDVAAWAIWNPILASLQQTFPTRVLRDARGLASNRAFYVGRRAFADEHPDLVDTFLGQVGVVGRWANESPAGAARILAPHLNIEASAVEAALSRTPFDTQPIDAQVVASQQRIADTLHRVRFIARPVNVEEAVWVRPWTVRRSA